MVKLDYIGLGMYSEWKKIKFPKEEKKEPTDDKSKDVYSL